ncbi:MAG: DUF2970 domain-containing protein [Rhodocyclaceae bacterium]|jgi:hypothetical protein|nr:DUF2970 domain-containing protein [Rhodocyclaceae bacterium]MCL4757226.1 DUF2970 domain-containing protein [Rhodocyclaceae bacterium]
MREEEDDPSARDSGRAGFLATIKAVLWAFFGVRRGRDHRLDAASLDPKAVILAGLLGGVLFVLGLLLVVHAVVD